MNDDQVIVDLVKYNNLVEFRKNIEKSNSFYIRRGCNSLGYGSYEYIVLISTDEAIEALRKSFDFELAEKDSIIEVDKKRNGEKIEKINNECENNLKTAGELFESILRSKEFDIEQQQIKINTLIDENTFLKDGLQSLSLFGLIKWYFKNKK